MVKPYLIPAEGGEKQIEIKKSRFIARAVYVSSRKQATNIIEDIRQSFPDARHHCWAYLIGNPESASSAAMNDDGEPSGTAGKPILNVIQHKKIGDILIVVTRYFGGIKLGAGGLTRAYSRAAEEVISSLRLKQWQSMVNIEVQCDFSREQLLRLWLEKLSAKLDNVSYQEQIHIRASISEEAVEVLKQKCNQYMIKLTVLK